MFSENIGLAYGFPSLGNESVMNESPHMLDDTGQEAFNDSSLLQPK
jgi:hypothetical protein